MVPPMLRLLVLALLVSVLALHVQHGGRCLVRGSVPVLDVTVLVDNRAEPGLEAAWGLSMLASSPGFRVLFDTGPSPRLLQRNAAVLGVNLSTVDAVVLSHLHLDHTGGLPAVLRAEPWVPVYGAPGAPASIVVRETMEIAPGFYLLRPLYGPPWETALVVNVTGYGLVMLVGCSHPGVARMVSEAERVLHGRVRLVIGGFHLAWAPRSRVVETVRELHSLGVEEAAPIHCSGSLVREVMEQMYPGMLLDVEAGDTVVVSASGVRVIRFQG